MSKFKFEDVKKSVEDQGWQLISDSYSNLNSDLLALCPNGHEVHFIYDDWRNNSVECGICNHLNLKKINEKPKKKKGYRILAFDQASITSGWSVFENNNLINYGCWTSHGNKSTERISQTKAWIASMIEQWKPDQVVFEDIQLQKFENGDAVLVYKKLAHLQGVLKNYCYENGIPYLIVPPSTWRNFNNVKGRTRTDQKKNAQIKVQALYGVQATEDESDSILIGRYAAAQYELIKIIPF